MIAEQMCLQQQQMQQQQAMMQQIMVALTANRSTSYHHLPKEVKILN